MLQNPAPRLFASLRIAIVLSLFVVIFLFATYNIAYAAGAERVVVGFVNAADASASPDTFSFVRKFALQKKFSIPQIGAEVFLIPDGIDVDAALSEIRARSDVRYAERDRIETVQFIPNDPCYTGSPCAQSSWYFPLMNFPSAWDLSTGSGVTIAVLDTGVNCTVADMAGQCVQGRNVVNSTNISPSVNSDDYGHGTWVASVAGAIGNNNFQITGAAFGSKIMPIKINQPGQGFAFFSDMAAGVLWANDHGVKIVNLSFGSTQEPDQTLQDAATTLRSNGGIVFKGAGNEGTTLTYANPVSIVTVGATDQNDALASFSNTGAAIDLTAPGIPINAVAINGNLSSVTGTSFATPLSAGVAALMKAYNPALTGAQIESIMETYAKDLGAAGRDNSFGWGRIDAGAALAHAGSGGSDTTAPSAPTNLAATPSSTQVSLTWTASTDNVGVTGYNVFRCTGSFCSPGTLIGTSATNSYTDTTVAAGTTYNYTVKAYDAAGNISSASNKVKVTTSTSSDTTPPSAPTNLAATPSSTQVALSWTASTDNVGVTGYNVFRCTGTCTPTSQIATPTSNSYTDTGVTGGTTYSYLVKARDAAGNLSGASNTVTTTVPTGGGSLTISNITVTTTNGLSKDTATIKWTTNIAANGLVKYGTSSTSLTLTKNGATAVTSQSVRLTQLTKGITYYYQITATTSSATAQSAVLSFVTP